MLQVLLLLMFECFRPASR